MSLALRKGCGCCEVGVTVVIAGIRRGHSIFDQLTIKKLLLGTARDLDPAYVRCAQGVG